MLLNLTVSTNFIDNLHTLLSSSLTTLFSNEDIEQVIKILLIVLISG